VALGDDFRIQRRYTGLPTGVTIATAWITVKRSERLDDADALFQKEITTAGTPDGHITDADTDDGDIDLYFEITGDDFADASPNLEYFYDVQVKTSANEIHTLEKGTIAFIRGVTDASS
jgi:hypothetical protein